MQRFRSSTYLLLLTLFLFSFLETKAEEPSEVAQFLSEYIQIPSVTGMEREAAYFLAERAKDKGLYVEMLHEDSASYNVAASLYPLETEKPNIVLLSHIDVVKASEPEAWKYPPFSGAIEDGAVWGRGAIDNKGMTAMQLFATAQFTEQVQNQDFPYNITLLAVSNEEQGGHLGAKRVVDTYFDYLNPAVVLGEGGMGVKGLIGRSSEMTVFGVSIAQKRGLWFDIVVDLPAAGHGAVPPHIYANRQLIEAINRIMDKPQPISFTAPARMMLNELGKLEGGIRGFALQNAWLFKPFLHRTIRGEPLLNALTSNTITLSNLENPETSTNQIPQWGRATFDTRLLPGTSTEEFLGDLRETLEGTGAEIEVIKETSPSLFTRPDHYYDLLTEAITETVPESAVIPLLFPANNDNNYFRAKGVPVYGILPAELTLTHVQTIHNIDENITLEGLNTGTNIYANFIRKFLTDDPPDSEASN